MACKYCTTKDLKNMKITDISYNPKVKYGDFYEISVIIHDVSWIYGDHARICVHDRTTMEQLYDSGAQSISPDEYQTFNYSGQMPNRNLNLKVSLIDDNIYPYPDDCEDYRDFLIKIGDTTEPPKPPGPIPDDLFQLIVLGVVVSIIVALIVGKLK